MYKVVKAFRDAQDNLYVYRGGDTYPRDGYEPDESRIKELASDQNRTGQRLIVEVNSSDGSYPEKDPERSEYPHEDSSPEGDNNKDSEGAEYPKHTGGGWYELSNGEKVQGKEEALEAESEL